MNLCVGLLSWEEDSPPSLATPRRPVHTAPVEAAAALCWVGRERHRNVLDLGADSLLAGLRLGMGRDIFGPDVSLALAGAGRWVFLPLVLTFPPLSHPQ